MMNWQQFSQQFEASSLQGLEKRLTAETTKRQVRGSFTEWCKYRGFEPARHHRFICDEIEDFLESDDQVLLLFAPPGSAKSTYVSVLFPPWYTQKYAGHSILAATHSVEFAERW